MSFGELFSSQQDKRQRNTMNPTFSRLTCTTNNNKYI